MKANSKAHLLIPIALLGLLMTAGGAGAAYYFLSSQGGARAEDSPPPADPEGEEAAAPPEDGTETPEEGGSAGPPRQGKLNGKLSSKARSVQRGEEGKSPGKSAGKAPGSGGQPVVLAFNNAASLARIGADLLTLYRDTGEAVLVRTLSDGGQTRTTVASDQVGSVAFATVGDLVMVVFTRSNAVYATLSEDGGATFKDIWTLATGTGRAEGPAVRFWRSGDQLHAVVTYHVGNKKVSDLYATSWTGGVWSEPVILDDNGEGSWATLEGQGDWTIAIWKDFRDVNASEGALYAADLPAPGAAWTPSRALGMEGADPSACMDASGVLHVGFQRTFRVLSYIRSADRGQTWSTPVTIDDDMGLFANVSCTNSGKVAIAWEKFVDHGSNWDNQVKVVGLARSKNGGDTFEVIPVQGDLRSQIRAMARIDESGAIDIAWIDMREEKPAVRWERIL